MSNDADLTDYFDGKNDGLMGYEPKRVTEAYMMGYNDGEVEYERSRYEAEYADGYEWDAVSQGMYDDDPNPYSGTY